jgi:hypothetical protein
MSHSHVCVARVTIVGIAMNALEVTEELLGVGGMRGCVLRIRGGGREPTGAHRGALSLYLFLFLLSFLVSCSTHGPLMPTFLSRVRDSARERHGGSVCAHPRGMACAWDAGLALRMRAGSHNVCGDTSTCRVSLGPSRCKCSGLDMCLFSPRAGRRSECVHARDA